MKETTPYFIDEKIAVPQTYVVDSVVDFLANKEKIRPFTSEHILYANIAAIKFKKVYYRKFNYNLEALFDKTGQIELWIPDEAKKNISRRKKLDTGVLLGSAVCLYDMAEDRTEDKMRLEKYRISRSKKGSTEAFLILAGTKQESQIKEAA